MIDLDGPTTKPVVATFSPTRLDDLTDHGWAAIGWRGTWQALWSLHEPTSPYHGQMLWMPLGEHQHLGLVPDEDLLDVEPLNGDDHA